MALVTVQRSPSPSDTPDTFSSDFCDGTLELESTLRSPQGRSRRFLLARKRFRKCLTGIRFVSRLRLSESYLSFKGAALILPQSECLRTVTKGTQADIQVHLQSMFYLLRPQDTIKMAVKLESLEDDLIRYMAVVTTVGVQDTEESIIVGIDIQDQEATIGLVLPVWGDMTIQLDGDGGFSIATHQSHHIFKPVSVQAMWSAWQCLIKIRDTASAHSYYPSGLTHTWILYYKINSSQACINEWNYMEGLESQRPESLGSSTTKSADETAQLEKVIRAKLREVMMTVDLEEVTSKYLRERVEQMLNMSLKSYRTYIDQEMIFIMRQMDSPSKIFDFLYLGSEWNASNLEELKRNGVGFILNVTLEIDNFFPGLFHYKNIRVYDVEESDLLKYWEDTYKFICKARRNRSKVLVHCKMGVSRSASSVIAFAMKDYGWSLDQALKYVKGKRSVIKPNDGFMKQLKTYEGILGASKQRHNKLWRTSSAGSLQLPDVPDASREKAVKPVNIPILSSSFGETRHDSLPSLLRPKSWSPHYQATDILLKAHGFASRDDSSDDDDEEDELFFESGDMDDDDEPMQFLLEATDTSSQSVEEWDEAVQDMDLPEDKKYVLSSPVVLVNMKPREDEIIPERDKLSDPDDGLDEDGYESRRVAGAYDVSMLESVQDEMQKNSNELANQKGEIDTSMSLLHLHPDYILEMALTKLRKQRMMSILLKPHQLQEGREGSQANVIVPQSDQLSSQVPSVAIRVKPDDYWIKDSLLPASSPTQDPDNQQTCDKTIDDIVPTTEPVSHSTPTGTTDPDADSSDSDQNEVMKPYIREDIPWSPGTVRRHAQDLEVRMTTAEIPTPPDFSGSPPSSNRLDSSPPAVSDCQADALVSTTSTTPPSQRLRPINLPISTSPSPSGSMSTAETSSVQICVDSSELEEQNSSSIYDTEEIKIEPGIVQRTKLEIEQRERSSSFVEMSPSTDGCPVQRSASCKDDKRSPNTRRRFDRSSERRRTCLPVLRPADNITYGFNSKSVDDFSKISMDCSSFKPYKDQSNLQGNVQVVVDSETDDGGKVTVQIGDEAIELESGIVRRQTRDFEGVSSEEKSHMSASCKSPPDGAENGIVLDEILIRHGSVKRTKEEMVERYAVKGAGYDKDETDSDDNCDEKQNKQASVSPPSKAETTSSQRIHRRLRHSLSSPQLSLNLGALAYPEEEEITWSVGTVRQHKEAIENIGQTCPSPVTPSPCKSALSDETLLLIREIGTAWSKSPRTGSVDGEHFEFAPGPGLVKRLTDQIEGISASEHIRKQMSNIKKKAVKKLDLDSEGGDSDSSSPSLKSQMSRSSSMRETSPRLTQTSREASAGRSSSFRTQTISKQSQAKKNRFRLEKSVDSGENILMKADCKPTAEKDKMVVTKVKESSPKSKKTVTKSLSLTDSNYVPSGSMQTRITKRQKCEPEMGNNSLDNKSKSSEISIESKKTEDLENTPESKKDSESHSPGKSSRTMFKNIRDTLKCFEGESAPQPTVLKKSDSIEGTQSPKLSGSPQRKSIISEGSTIAFEGVESPSPKITGPPEGSPKAKKYTSSPGKSRPLIVEEKKEMKDPKTSSTLRSPEKGISLKKESISDQQKNPKRNVERKTHKKSFSEPKVKNLRGIFEAQRQVSPALAGNVPDKFLDKSEEVSSPNADVVKSTYSLNLEITKPKSEPAEPSVKSKYTQSATCDSGKVDSSENVGDLVLLSPDIKGLALRTLFPELGQDSQGRKRGLSVLSDVDSNHQSSIGSSSAGEKSNLRSGLIKPAPGKSSEENDSPVKQDIKHLRTPSPQKQHLQLSSAEPDPSRKPNKFRKLQGKSHPLTKLTGETPKLGGLAKVSASQGRTNNPIYNTL